MERKMRYAIVMGDKPIGDYLPDNYVVMSDAVVGELPVSLPDGPIDWGRVPFFPGEHGVIVGGYDVAGWTLDGYVLPRLASGLYFGCELFAGVDCSE
jgi:hypothetical protein